MPATFGVQREYVLIPPGKYRMFLKSVEIVQMDDRFGKTETGKVERGKWRFECNPRFDRHVDEDGVPYDFVVYTGLQYGNEKAALTRLADMLAPGMTREKFPLWDYKALIGAEFTVQIKHVEKDGKKRADYVLISEAPKGRAWASNPPPAMSVEEAPFEDDEEEI